MHMPTIVVAHY